MKHFQKNSEEITSESIFECSEKIVVITNKKKRKQKLLLLKTFIFAKNTDRNHQILPSKDKYDTQGFISLFINLKEVLFNVTYIK